MRLALLGASGGCGSLVAQLAAGRGHRVTALVRPATPYDPPRGVEVLRGEALDSRTLDALLPGHDAVLCCLGIRRRRQTNPWSPLVSPPDLCARAGALLVEALPRHGIHRLVAISAAGVGESAAHMSRCLRWLFAASKVGIAYADLGVMERTLEQSALDWLAVRPTTLAGGPARGAREVAFFGLKDRITRSDVAAWLVDAVERATPFAKHTEMISGR